MMLADIGGHWRRVGNGGDVGKAWATWEKRRGLRGGVAMEKMRAPLLGLRLNELVTPTIPLFIIAIVGVVIILGVLPRCLHHILGLGGSSLGLWGGRLGLRGLGRGGGRRVGRVGTDRREVFSHMHGAFRVPIPLHCPCRAPPGALPVRDNTLVHRRGLPRGEVGARPPFRIDVMRRAPTCHALGNLRARGHSAASRPGIETG